MEKVNWSMVGIQAISTIVIVVITLLTFTSQANQALRNVLRAELNEIRAEMHDMNRKLGRLEGLLRQSAKGDGIDRGWSRKIRHRRAAFVSTYNLHSMLNVPRAS